MLINECLYNMKQNVKSKIWKVNEATTGIPFFPPSMVFQTMAIKNKQLLASKLVALSLLFARISFLKSHTHN